jgi:hypothetical protein
LLTLRVRKLAHKPWLDEFRVGGLEASDYIVPTIIIIIPAFDFQRPVRIAVTDRLHSDCKRFPDGVEVVHDDLGAVYLEPTSVLSDSVQTKEGVTFSKHSVEVCELFTSELNKEFLI